MQAAGVDDGRGSAAGGPKDLSSNKPMGGPASVQAARQGPKKPTIHYPFWFGGSASSMAACVTHPLDLVKVRLQMRSGDAPKSMRGTFIRIVSSQGLRGLYTGLSASLLRQITYSTTRFGIYEELKQRATTAAQARVRDDRSVRNSSSNFSSSSSSSSSSPSLNNKNNKSNKRPAAVAAAAPSFPLLVAIASVSGFAGGVMGNGADIVNVRMQHDAALPPAQRRNYRHALEGMYRIWRDEGGFRSWFRGVLPNGLRAAAMTAGQLASYDLFKRLLVQAAPAVMADDGLATHFSASLLAGVAAATITSPIDVVKTRVMSASSSSSSSSSSPPSSSSRASSTSILAVVRGMFVAEGPRWMFKGWVPSFLRLGPQTICTFLFLESHRKLYRKVRDLDD